MLLIESLFAFSYECDDTSFVIHSDVHLVPALFASIIIAQIVENGVIIETLDKVVVVCRQNTNRPTSNHLTYYTQIC